MKKQTARELLGPDDASIARAMGITRSAVNQWPEVLPKRTANGVIAARLRQEWLQALGKRPGASKNMRQQSDALPPLIADALFDSE